MSTHASASSEPMTGLTDVGKRVFAYVVDYAQPQVEEIARGLNMQDGEVTAALHDLRKLGLVRLHGVQASRVTAVSPGLAAAELLASLETEAAEQKRHIAKARETVAALQLMFDAGAARRSIEGSELLTELEDVLAVIRSMASRTTAEVLCAQPGGPRSLDSLAEAAERDEAMLRRGVAMRTIYQHSESPRV
jgi:DNA-binding MarR family transcriptional regulator